eukprot:scaffold13067_cov56-Isochrysis_galbana.AAC.1
MRSENRGEYRTGRTNSARPAACRPAGDLHLRASEAAVAPQAVFPCHRGVGPPTVSVGRSGSAPVGFTAAVGAESFLFGRAGGAVPLLPPAADGRAGWWRSPCGIASAAPAPHRSRKRKLGGSVAPAARQKRTRRRRGFVRAVSGWANLVVPGTVFVCGVGSGRMQG